MTLLAIAVIRGVVGLCIVAVAIAMLVYAVIGEMAGCMNSIILGVLLLVYFIAQTAVGSEPIDAFIGTDSWEIMAGLLVVTVGCFFFPGSKIAGILSSIALGYAGLIITGFFAADDISTLTGGILDMGIIIMLPIVLPIALLCVLLALILRS